MQSVKFFLVLLIAPFIGLCIAVSGLDVSTDHLLLPTKNVTASIDSIEESFCDMEGKFGAIKAQVDVQKSGYEEQEQTLSGLTGQASEHKKMSDQIYEDRILTMLGSPVRMHKSKRVEVKVFKLDELDYRGYIAKVKLLNPTVAKVILAKDKLGEKETTLEAVKRTGAILGINAGGFYTEMREGKP
ncbi:MAG: phosphodiester glycosidase family protein, partial [Clostridia bacterium]|nr:phosphodiester glycosidase family protein [Clostridia bacterium]